MAKGALGTDPKFTLATDSKGLNKQRSDLNRIAQSGGAGAQAARQQLSQVEAALKNLKKSGGGTQSQSPTDKPEQLPTSTPGYDKTLQQSNDATSSLFNQIGNQGAFNYQGMGISQFNPGDFEQQRQQAYDSAMNQFNRTAQPAFDKQEQDWQQMAAERGWDPTSKPFADAHTMQVSNPQNTARQNAMDAAYGQGLAAQGQAYGQASNTYGQNLNAQGQQFGQYYQGFQAPYQNLSYLSPYFNAQAQQGQLNTQLNFTGGQNALDRQQQFDLARQQNQYAMQQLQYSLAHQKGGGGGGGGLSLADQMALQNNGFYNQAALLGLQGSGMPQISTGNQLINGLASGIGAGIGAGLK